MPIYEYLCEDCGDFSSLQPIELFDRPQPCPHCGEFSPRVVLSAPNIAQCSEAARAAHRRNEQSVEKPKRGRAKANGHHGHRHAHPASVGRSAAGRPWMLSH